VSNFEVFPTYLSCISFLFVAQPLILLAAPGDENILVQCATALLLLCRPLVWQYLYLPIVSEGVLTLLNRLVNEQKPFLVGMYHYSLKSLIRSQLKMNIINEASLHEDDLENMIAEVPQRSYLSRITVLDLDAGVVIPGSQMKFAGRCLLTNFIDPDLYSQPFYVEGESTEMKPPIPARYLTTLRRSKGASKSTLMNSSNSNRTAIVNAAALSTISTNRSIAPRGGGSPRASTLNLPVERLEPIGDLETAREVAEILHYFTKELFVSLFKSVPLFLRSRPGFSVANHPTADEYCQCLAEEEFLGSLKVDVRPFVRFVIRTYSFQVNSQLFCNG